MTSTAAENQAHARLVACAQRYDQFFRRSVADFGRLNTSVDIARYDAFAAAVDVVLAFDPSAAAIADTSAMGFLAIEVMRRVDSKYLLVGAPSDEVVFAKMWCAAGRPTFSPTAGLAAELLLVDASNVAQNDVAWPFDAFRILLPHPGCEIHQLRHDGVTPERTLWIQTMQWRIVGDAGSTAAAALSAARGYDAFATALRRVVADARDVFGSAAAQTANITRAFSRVGASVFKNQTWDTAATLGSWFETVADSDGQSAVSMCSDSDMFPADRHALLMSQRVAVNLALYLSSDDAETGTATWTPRARGAGKAGTNWTIGQSVKVGPEVRAAAADVAAGCPASPVSVRHIVRGHFINQACGKGRAEHRRQYRKPVWRNLHGAAGADRTYDVK